AGLLWLEANARAGEDPQVIRNDSPLGLVGSAFRRTVDGPAEAGPHEQRPVRCVDRYLWPEPRVRIGQLLSRNRAATSCIDLSDGLADAVHQIAEASGVGLIIDADAIPIDD